MVIKTRDLGEKLLSRDAEAVGTLMEALVGVGIAMAFVGNSRPASGSEHHLSHFFEIVGILNDEPYFMHGTDVVYSTVYTQRIREQLIALAAPAARELPSQEAREQQIREIYTDIADSVIALQNKMGWYDEARWDIYASRWDEIVSVLREAPSSEEMLRYLKSVDLDIARFDELYGAEKIGHALRFAKDLKDRFTVLWLYYDLLA